MSGYRRFFLSNVSEEFVVEGEEFRHAVNVLRIKEGEKIIVCDNSGWDYLCEVSKISKKSFTVKMLEKSEGESEAKTSVTLIAGYFKGDKTEIIVK